jgi:hypothetical protein
MLVDILRGSAAKKIPVTFKKFDVYNKGAEYPDRWWKVLITLMINHKYVSEVLKPGSRGPQLIISPKGTEWSKAYAKDNTTTLVLPLPQEMADLIDTKPIKKVKKVVIDVNKTNKIVIDTNKTRNDSNNKTIGMDDIFELLKEGKNIDEIANQLEIPSLSVENYICDLYKKDYDINLESFGFSDKVYNLISDKIDEINNIDKLKDIKNGLPKYISFFHIKLAIIKKNKVVDD